ncbi:MAG TPA: PH domain-containing protein [Kribbellaceae bacterium]
MAEPVWQFRPRVLPVIATGMAVSLVLVFGVVAVRLPESSQRTFTIFQRATLLAFFAVILWILYRMATLKVTAYDDGLAVRNVFRSYRIEWRRISVLRFSSGDPWLQLFDAEGNRLGVLAIQAADGARASRAAKSLATVAKSHGAGAS